MVAEDEDSRVAWVGLGSLFAYAWASLWMFPGLLWQGVDSGIFRYSVLNQFIYGSSPLDVSAISPVQGLGGLIQPLAVWLHPAYAIDRLLTGQLVPGFVSYLSAMMVLGVATFLLGRSLDVPSEAAVIASQIIVLFSFPPLWNWTLQATQLNGVHLYALAGPVAVPVGLAVLALALFCYLGTGGIRRNLTCLVLLPVVVVHAILCDPLYTAIFIVPLPILGIGTFLGPDLPRARVWRLAGVVATALTVLVLGLHRFYEAISGYAARAVFPNELYVEVQKWDYLTALLFQGRLATVAVIGVLACCGILIAVGSPRQRSFGFSVAGFVLVMVGLSLVYVYSGMRWAYPLPVYFEVVGHPAYAVTAVMGLWLVLERLRSRLSSPGARRWASIPIKRSGRMALVLVLPGLAAMVLLGEWLHAKENIKTEVPLRSPVRSRIIQYLEREIGVSPGGEFKGSVASVVGVPGSPVADMLGFPRDAPYSKGNIDLVPAYLRKTFDPNLHLTGLWSLGVPTLEDNNQLVSPPFHFLFSRALSRPQDFHSRNWTMITRVRPSLMGALGARFLITDAVEPEGALHLRLEEKNRDGVALRLYEIHPSNLATFSPTRVQLARDAKEGLERMTSPEFRFEQDVVLYEPVPSELVPAEGSRMSFERGGVRVKARSRGRSLLLLPLQFSNSLAIVGGGAGRTEVKLLRANLLETAVLFSGELEIKMAHIFGPLRRVDGRLQDIEDCRRLGIKETGEIPYPPGYQPLAIWPGPVGARAGDR